MIWIIDSMHSNELSLALDALKLLQGDIVLDTSVVPYIERLAEILRHARPSTCLVPHRVLSEIRNHFSNVERALVHTRVKKLSRDPIHGILSRVRGDSATYVRDLIDAVLSVCASATQIVSKRSGWRRLCSLLIDRLNHARSVQKSSRAALMEVKGAVLDIVRICGECADTIISILARRHLNAGVWFGEYSACREPYIADKEVLCTALKYTIERGISVAIATRDEDFYRCSATWLREIVLRLRPPQREIGLLYLSRRGDRVVVAKLQRDRAETLLDADYERVVDLLAKAKKLKDSRS